MLNCSNLSLDGFDVENAFIMIRRFKDDREYSDERSPFQVSNGEVNRFHPVKVRWPVTYQFI